MTSDYRLSYDGQTIVDLGGGETRPENHSIKNIEVNNTNDENYPEGAVHAVITEGGLFGSHIFGEIKNLELIDFNVNLTSGNVGALFRMSLRIIVIVLAIPDRLPFRQVQGMRVA